MGAERLIYGVVTIFLFAVLFLFAVNFVFAIGPVGPDFLNVTANETKAAAGVQMLNTSGGYITTLNITARTQNPRWKAFVGRVSGKFTLDDASGSTIYDWTVASVSGEIYATRNSSTIQWGSISCASTSALESENNLMSLRNAYDNITATFRNSSNPEFFVGATNISLNSCPHNINTYVGNQSQTAYFKEITLNSSTAIIYATILENNRAGFDTNPYEFQMIVPEIGSEGWSGATAYYLYVEIT